MRLCVCVVHEDAQVKRGEATFVTSCRCFYARPDTTVHHVQHNSDYQARYIHKCFARKQMPTSHLLDLGGTTSCVSLM